MPGTKRDCTPWQTLAGHHHFVRSQTALTNNLLIHLPVQLNLLRTPRLNLLLPRLLLRRRALRHPIWWYLAQA